MNWVMMMYGVLLFMAPFFLGYADQPGPLWLSLMSGAAIAAFSGLKMYKWAAVCGLFVAFWPLIFGFTGTHAAVICWVIGGLTALNAGYVGYTSDQKPDAHGLTLEQY